MFVINQVKFILGSNLVTIQNGYSVAKNAGMMFQKKINILMEELESHKLLRIENKIKEQYSQLFRRDENEKRSTYFLK